MSKTRVLVVAAHPDDETLGCAGTIAGHVAAGEEVFITFLTDGVGARLDQMAHPDANSRQKMAHKAADLLGAHIYRFHDYPDNALDSVPRLELAQAVERVLAETKPQIVYTHFAGDLNVDHRRACEATLIACRPLPGRKITAILGYEVLSSTEWSPPGYGGPFAPQAFFDISDHMEKKRRALRAYGSEIPDAPHPRSVETIGALAQLRGAAAGLDLAEAFEVYRQIRFL